MGADIFRKADKDLNSTSSQHDRLGLEWVKYTQKYIFMTVNSPICSLLTEQ